ncbi:MAG: hypothetical protein HQ582_20005, partial [Planctomycetes bacterium]|nr:hypothetical protein [Planctomycetota bacterium]
TLLRGWGVDVPAVTEQVARAYAESLMYGEHTWGYSMSPFGYHYGDEWQKLRDEGHYARLETSWGEHGAYARNAREAVSPAIAENVAAMAAAVKIDGPRIVVHNPLPWTRDEVVDVSLPSLDVSGLKEATTGEPVEVTLSKTGLLRFVARELPPLGYRTYVPAVGQAADSAVADDSTTIESTYFRARMDPSRGVIASLVDKRSGRELVDASSEYGCGQYVYERFDTQDIKTYFDAYLKYIPGWSPHFARAGMSPATETPHSIASPKEFDLRISANDVFVTARMATRSVEGFPHQVALFVTLFRNRPYVDLRWKIIDKKADQWPEAGWLCLPFEVHQPTFRLGRLGSVIDPAVDARRGSNFDVFCLNTGMTITGPDYGGVGFCPIDSPLASIGRPGLYQHSGQFGSRQPVVFVNLFNNVWGTNFQQWTEGTWSSRIRIWSVEGKGIEADLVTPGWEARSRAEAAFFDGPAGVLPPSRSGIELSRKGVLVTAFGPNPDGEGILLRLWEQGGEDGICRVRLPDGIDVTRAQPCDLRGRPQGDAIPVENNSIDVPLTHYAPVSLILAP